MSTTIEKGMLVATRDVDITGIWRGKTGRVGRIVGPNIWLWIRGESQLAGPFTADQLGPSPQLNLLVEGEGLEQKEKPLPLSNFRGAVVRSLLEIKVTEGTGEIHDPIREVTYLLDQEGRTMFVIDPNPAEIEVHDRREEAQ